LKLEKIDSKFYDRFKKLSKNIVCMHVVDWAKLESVDDLMAQQRGVSMQLMYVRLIFSTIGGILITIRISECE